MQAVTHWLYNLVLAGFWTLVILCWLLIAATPTLLLIYTYKWWRRWT